MALYGNENRQQSVWKAFQRRGGIGLGGQPGAAAGARWMGPARARTDAGRTTRADRSHGRRQRPAPTHAGRNHGHGNEYC